MKKYIVFCLFALCLTGCESNKKNIVDSKSIFKSNVNEVLKIVENDSKIDNKKNYYFIKNKKMNVRKFDIKQDMYIDYTSYDFSNYSFNDGVLMLDENNRTYLSIYSSEYCAVKDYMSEDIEIYDIKNKEKCRLYLYNGNALYANIVFMGDEKSKILYTISNLYDENYAIYTWYKNDNVVENSNHPYLVISGADKANYKVMIKLQDGSSVMTDIVNY